MKAKKITGDELENVLTKDSGTVMLRFEKDGCPHCRALAPHWESAAEHYGGNVSFYDVDTDESPEIARRFGVRSVPTVMRFVGGRETARALGAIKEAELFGMVQGGVFQL